MSFPGMETHGQVGFVRQQLHCGVHINKSYEAKLDNIHVSHLLLRRKVAVALQQPSIQPISRSLEVKSKDRVPSRNIQEPPLDLGQADLEGITELDKLVLCDGVSSNMFWGPLRILKSLGSRLEACSGGLSLVIVPLDRSNFDLNGWFKVHSVVSMWRAVLLECPPRHHCLSHHDA